MKSDTLESIKENDGMRKWSPEWFRHSNLNDLLEMNSEATATLHYLSQSDVDLARLIWKSRLEMIKQEMELRARTGSKASNPQSI